MTSAPVEARQVADAAAQLVGLVPVAVVTVAAVTSAALHPAHAEGRLPGHLGGGHGVGVRGGEHI